MGRMAYATWIQTWAFEFQKSGLFEEQSQAHNLRMRNLSAK